MAETIIMPFTIPPGAVLENLGGGRFHVKHPGGWVELIEVFPNSMPIINRCLFLEEPTIEWGPDDAA